MEACHCAEDFHRESTRLDTATVSSQEHVRAGQELHAILRDSEIRDYLSSGNLVEPDRVPAVITNQRSNLHGPLEEAEILVLEPFQPIW
jgi:hypothetical protein